MKKVFVYVYNCDVGERHATDEDVKNLWKTNGNDCGRYALDEFEEACNIQFINLENYWIRFIEEEVN